MRSAGKKRLSRVTIWSGNPARSSYHPAQPRTQLSPAPMRRAVKIREHRKGSSSHEWCLYLAAVLLLAGSAYARLPSSAIPYKGIQKFPLDHPPPVIRWVKPGEWNDDGELTSLAVEVKQVALGVHYFIDVELTRDIVVEDRIDHSLQWYCRAESVLGQTEAVMVVPCAVPVPGEYEVRIKMYDLHPDLAEEDTLLASIRTQMVVETPQWFTALDEDLRSLLLRHAPHKVRNVSEIHIGHRRQHPAAQAVELFISIATDTSSSNIVCVQAEGLSLGAEYLLSLTISCAESRDGKRRQGDDREWNLPDQLFVHAVELQQLRLSWLVRGGGDGGEDGPMCQFMTITARISDCFPLSNGEAPLLLASRAKVAVVTSGLFEEVMEEEEGEEGEEARGRAKTAITCNSTISASAAPSSTFASSSTSQAPPWSGRGGWGGGGEGGRKGDGDVSCSRVAVVVHGQRCYLPPTLHPTRPPSELLSQPSTLPPPSLLPPLPPSLTHLSVSSTVTHVTTNIHSLARDSL